MDNDKYKNGVLIVDDHKLMIDGLRNMLANADYYIVADATDAKSAVDILKEKSDEIDIIITDINLPGENGLELVRKIKKSYPDIKIIILTMHDERSIVTDAIALGVNAYLLKNLTQQQFIHALNLVKIGKFYISEEVSFVLADKINPKSAASILSEREKEILRLVAREYSNRQIADALCISERTVETHRRNIFTKTNNKSIVGLIQYAIKYGLI